MTGLVLLGTFGIGLLLVLILGLKLQPFVALVLVSLMVALAAGLPIQSIPQTIEEGLGKSLGHIALIIALGAMIGRLIDQSGGAEQFAQALISRFGSRRAALALSIAGFFIGIPVFFEVGVIMLMPLAYGVARRDGRNIVTVALPMCIALLIVHALLPPHPGAVAIAALLGADIGRMLLLGLPVAAVTSFAAYLLSTKLSSRPFDLTEVIGTPLAADAATLDPGAVETPPPVATIVLMILFPIVLILSSTLSSTLLLPTSLARRCINLVGTPFVALLLDVLLCAWTLGARRGWSRERIADVIGSAIPGVSVVILITGGGAIFASILVKTGIGDAVAALLYSTGLPFLVLAFLLTMLIRAMQGPTTVALMTTGGIIGPFAAHARLDNNHLALLCLAMGSGGIAVSHVNDAGFWIVTRLLGLNVKDGLRTWTVLTTAAGCCAFGCIALLWIAL